MEQGLREAERSAQVPTAQKEQVWAPDSSPLDSRGWTLSPDSPDSGNKQVN